MPKVDSAAVSAAPFLKWAGGKRSLLPKLLPFVPKHIHTYYEPFLGGGALFFALMAKSAASRRSATPAGGARARPFRTAVLSDTNDELISCYLTIRSDVDAVVKELSAHEAGEDHFYRVRDQDPSTLSAARRAARTIYLNRNGYNGLFRVNRSGRFNVPFGKHVKLRTVAAERLRHVARALQNVTLQVCDFAESVKAARARDFIYFDPPYVPVSPTSSFTAYAAGGFGAQQQARLADLIRRLGAAGIPALLSNSDCPETRSLYQGLPTEKVLVPRPINSVAADRGNVAELIVRSFDYPC